jgi:hypothetical protein
VASRPWNPKDAPGRTFAQQHPRHPAQVTSDRLGDHLTSWHDRIEPGDRDLISQVRHILECIAEEDGRG